MQILEYKLHLSEDGLVKPIWITNGGYFNNPDDYTYIGVAVKPNEFHIPDTVNVLTLAEVKTRQLAIHGKHPMPRFHFTDGKNAEDNPHLTNDEIEANIDTWHDEVVG